MMHTIPTHPDQVRFMQESLDTVRAKLVEAQAEIRRLRKANRELEKLNKSIEAKRALFAGG